MIVVTGGAGFIGSNLVRGLNRRAREDIIVVDDEARGRENLADLAIADFLDKREFFAAAKKLSLPVTAVFHQGACTDTMATDRDYVMENNLAYSKSLYEFCAAHNAQYIYASSASVYGDGDVFVESPQYESTLNLYAESKLLFDQFVRVAHAQSPAFQCVGLRYFNVYGVREQHKNKMASVAWHFFHQYRDTACVKLFKGSDGYAHGEQRRDFISVDDIVAVNLFFLDNPSRGGIVNVGSGRSGSFNEVALAVLNTCRANDGAEQTTVAQAVAAGEIVYINMPDALRGKYQSFTEANLDNLRATGYAAPFADVAHGVGDYVNQLLAQR